MRFSSPPHVPRVMCHVSCATFHVPHVLCHISCATCPVPRALCHVSCTTCPVPRVLCHVSCATCHVSCATCPVRFILLDLISRIIFVEKCKLWSPSICSANFGAPQYAVQIMEPLNIQCKLWSPSIYSANYGAPQYTVQIMEPLNIQFSVVSCYFISLRPKYLPQRHVLEHTQPVFFP